MILVSLFQLNMDTLPTWKEFKELKPMLDKTELTLKQVLKKF